MARASPTQSILDGDVFQPIWYNWACRYPPEFLSKEETHAFYKSMLAEEKIAFPDSRRGKRLVEAKGAGQNAAAQKF